MSILLVIVVIFFRYYLDKNVIDSLLTVAQYTYGPLLGLFAFGIFTNYKVHDDKVFMVVIINIILIIFIIEYYYRVIHVSKTSKIFSYISYDYIKSC